MEPIVPRSGLEDLENAGKAVAAETLAGHQSSWDALYQRNQELERNVKLLNAELSAARQSEKRANDNYNVISKQLCDVQAARQFLVEEIVEACAQRLQPQFSPELLAKIAAHVEPKPEKQIASPVPVGRVEWVPDFVSAEESELRERVRCAAIVSSGEGLAETMQKILSGFDPFNK